MRSLRYILADELHCFPPDAVQTALDELGITYVQLLERIATVLAQKPDIFFKEIARSLPSYWQVYVQDQYPESVRNRLLESLRVLDGGLALWESLAPYVLKKATTLAVETVIYERQDWVMALLRSWSAVSVQLDALPDVIEPKRPMLGMVLEGQFCLNRVQILAIDAAQKEARVKGEPVPFGEMAIRKGFITEEQLQDGLQIQRDIAVALDSPKRLGFYLLEAGVVSPRQLRDALRAQSTSGMPLGQVLVAQGTIDQSLLETMLSIQRQERITTFTQDLAG